jgi:hypothetical protein
MIYRYINQHSNLLALINYVLYIILLLHFCLAVQRVYTIITNNQACIVL